MSAERMPISHGIAPLADIPDREGGDGGPELMIRGEHPVIAMPVLPRRRHEISEPVEEVTRREFDDAAGVRPRGLPPAPRADPVGCLVPWQHAVDAPDAAIFTAPHGEPLQREGRTGAIPHGRTGSGQARAAPAVQIGGHLFKAAAGGAASAQQAPQAVRRSSSRHTSRTPRRSPGSVTSKASCRGTQPRGRRPPHSRAMRRRS